MASKEIIEQPLPMGDSSSIILMPTMNLELAMARLMEFQAFVRNYLVEGEDYGIIPGTPKPTLFKPGADKLCELYGLADSYTILAKTEDWDRGLFDYTIECQLSTRRTSYFVSSGLGCCSSWESKYRYRQAQRKCPKCGKEAIIKGSEQYGGGFVCWKKKDGCGAKFLDNDPAITEQAAGKIDNPDIVDTKNTILKMAKKRAKIDATLSATRSSGIFTQDIEDMPHNGPRTPEEQNDYATAGYDRDEHVKKTTEKLKQQVDKQGEQEDNETYAWRMRIAKCSTVEDFNSLFPDADNASDDIQIWIGKKAATCGYLYDRSKHCFYDPNSRRTTEQLKGSLAVTPPVELEPISKQEENQISAARRKAGISIQEWTDIKGRYGVEHTRDLTRGNFTAIMQDIKDRAPKETTK